MSPAGGSRFYQGPGLGEAMWACPSCGAENQGPIAGGCAVCGAGDPKAAPPPPPPDLEPPQVAQGDMADYWAAKHPDATIADAYRAGYLEAQQHWAQRQQQPPTGVASGAAGFSPEGKVGRTIVAALMVFRDQVLATDPEEITSGEWLSVAEVTQLIRQINQQVQHA